VDFGNIVSIVFPVSSITQYHCINFVGIKMCQQTKMLDTIWTQEVFDEPGEYSGETHTNIDIN